MVVRGTYGSLGSRHVIMKKQHQLF